MERSVECFVNEWSSLKGQEVLEFLRDSMAYVAQSNLPISQLNEFLGFAERSYQSIGLELCDDLITMNNRVAAQWQLVCSDAREGVVVPESITLKGADFMRSTNGVIRDLDVYFDFNQVARVQRLMLPSAMVPDESVVQLRQPEPSGDNGAQLNLQSYRKSGLSESAMEQIAHRLETALVGKRLYLENELNLTRLAEQLNVRADYLSQVISQRFQSNFYQLLAGYRIEEARRLLSQNPRQAVVEIGFAVGFNSKSVFYSEFRKQVGMTPAAYRRKLLK